MNQQTLQVVTSAKTKILGVQVHAGKMHIALVKEHVQSFSNVLVLLDVHRQNMTRVLSIVATFVPKVFSMMARLLIMLFVQSGIIRQNSKHLLIVFLEFTVIVQYSISMN